MGLDLRQALTGAAIRTIAGIVDAGEIIAGFVSNIDGGNLTEIADDKSDVYVHVREARADATSTDGGRPITARLFAAANALWRLPLSGDSVTVIRPADADGPGVPVAMHGDGGAKNQVPSWLDKNNSGTSVPEAWIVESTGDKVVIRSNTGGTSASFTLTKQGAIQMQDAAGLKISTDGTSSITVDATGVASGSITLNANPVTGAVKLGPVGSLQVLVQGALDSLGVPITQAPAAVLSIVKAG